VSDFTHDGNILTGSETGRPVVYDLQSRQVIDTLRGHSDVVLAVSAHDKLPLLCTGGMTADRKVHFWMRRDDDDEEEEEADGAAGAQTEVDDRGADAPVQDRADPTSVDPQAESRMSIETSPAPNPDDSMELDSPKPKKSKHSVDTM
jgi:WD40 repeat protein